MSMLAGIVSRSLQTPVPDDAKRRLRQLISRHAAEPLETYEDQHALLLKADFGAFGHPGFERSLCGSVAIVAGEPSLYGQGSSGTSNRARDLTILHESWDREDWKPLESVRGVFAAVYYRPATRTICLIADKLGVRPIFYWMDDSVLVFASALRVLEEMLEVRKRIDMVGATQIASFGFALGDRTAYEGVRRIKSAEVIEISPTRSTKRQYWRWDEIAPANCTESEGLEEAHRRFLTAVRLRVGTDSTVLAMLSGGLDSRCVVASLRALQIRVHTFNISPRGSQDEVFGGAFAQLIGSTHHQIDKIINHPEVRSLFNEVRETSPSLRRWPPERPRVVWSGDGGSVGFGHVYMSPAVVALLRERKLNQAIDAFLREQKCSVLTRLLHPRLSMELAGCLHDSMLAEFTQLHATDPGRDLYVFLLMNDQRHHLSLHFENIDLLREEIQAPFYDSDFLAWIAALPLELCLLHRAYTKWLRYFDPAVFSVPWQAYPGHEGCTLPVPNRLPQQWQRGAFSGWEAFLRNELLRESANMLARGNFPDAILNKQYVRLTYWLEKFRLRDYGYVLDKALIYSKYWNRTGRSLLPLSPPAFSAKH